MTGSHKVIGSIPIYSTNERVAAIRPFFDNHRGSSSSGRAFGSQSKGSGFESHLLHRKETARQCLAVFLLVVAHLVEHLLRNQKVVGCRPSRRRTTSPIYSTKGGRNWPPFLFRPIWRHTIQHWFTIWCTKGNSGYREISALNHIHGKWRVYFCSVEKEQIIILNLLIMNTLLLISIHPAWAIILIGLVATFAIGSYLKEKELNNQLHHNL